MFEITREELENLSSQFVISSWGGSRYLPMAFTEHGVLMLSSVLKSDQAIEMNIQIVRIFSKMKEMLLTNKDILLKLEKIENKLISHDEDIAVLFSYLKQLMKAEDQRNEQSSRKRIGYKPEK